MTPAEATRAYNSLLPELAGSASPADVLIKYAAERQFAPAQLEKLGHVHNTFQAVYTMTHGPSRDASYALLDVPRMLEKFASFAPVPSTRQMPEQTTDVHVCKNLAEFLDVTNGDWKSRGVIELRKAASAPAAITPPTTQELERQILEASELRCTLERAYNQVKRAMAHALYARPSDAQLLVEDIEAFRKTACISSTDLLEMLGREVSLPELAGVVKRAGVRRLERDRTNLLSQFDDLIEITEGMRMAEEVVKQASTTLADLQQQARQRKGPVADTLFQAPKRRSQSDTTVPLEFEGADAGRGFALDNIPANDAREKEQEPQELGVLKSVDELNERANEALTNTTIERYLTDWTRALIPTRNKGQERIDADLAKERGSIALTKLMLTDPVLRDADPERVVSFASTVMQTDPSIMEDENTLRYILREAVQYDGIPPQTIGDIAKTRGQKLTNDKSERELSSARYNLPGLGVSSAKKDTSK